MRFPASNRRFHLSPEQLLVNASPTPQLLPLAPAPYALLATRAFTRAHTLEKLTSSPLVEVLIVKTLLRWCSLEILFPVRRGAALVSRVEVCGARFVLRSASSGDEAQKAARRGAGRAGRREQMRMQLPPLVLLQLVSALILERIKQANSDREHGACVQIGPLTRGAFLEFLVSSGVRRKSERSGP